MTLMDSKQATRIFALCSTVVKILCFARVVCRFNPASCGADTYSLVLHAHALPTFVGPTTMSIEFCIAAQGAQVFI